MITRDYNPITGSAGIPPPKVRETGEESMLGFKGQNLSDMRTIDLLVDYLRERLTATEPSTIDHFIKIFTPLTQAPYIFRDNQFIENTPDT